MRARTATESPVPATSAVRTGATHVRVGDPFYVPVILGAIAWLGLYLRDARLRALVPWRS